MKMIATGDWHLHNFKDFSSIVMVDFHPDKGFQTMGHNNSVLDKGWELAIPMNSRLYRTASAVQSMFDYAVDNGIELCIIAGDVFHERGGVETTVYNTAYRLFQYASGKGLHLLVIPGNHDQKSNEEHPEHSLLALNALIGVEVVSSPCLMSFKGQNIFCVPFTKSKQSVLKHVRGIIDHNPAADVSQMILMAHLGINGAFVGTNSYALADDFTTTDLHYDAWKYVVLGHFHKPQVLEYNTFYTGSITQNNFNDEGNPQGFWVIDTDKRYDMEHKSIPEIPEFRTVQATDEHWRTAVCNNPYDFFRLKGSHQDAGLEPSDEEVLVDIKVELERTFETEHRSDISITQGWSEMVKTYAGEIGANEALGLDILHTVLEGGAE